MKTDLATSVVAAVIGVVVAYFVCGIFLPEIADVSFDVIDSKNLNYSLTNPNPEVFNYRAVNPTVPVIIPGECDTLDSNGNCVDDTTNLNTPEEETPETPAETPAETPEETPEEETNNNEENENGPTD